jgi:small nuclear ribonucleoprotein (snRNP)-like protein
MASTDTLWPSIVGERGGVNLAHNFKDRRVLISLQNNRDIRAQDTWRGTDNGENNKREGSRKQCKKQKENKQKLTQEKVFF